MRFSSLLVFLALWLQPVSSLFAFANKRHRQLIFQVKTDKYPDKLYQFYSVSSGEEHKLLYLEYYRKTRVKIPK